uniref:Endoribonuclease YbeY n=1 Tax=Eiseniibacteriota bacterium TaxID=2212470 RepID=A0A832I7D2_UNCEI
MPISVRTDRRHARLAPALRALVRVTLAGEGLRPGEVGVVLTGDGELRDLNRRWRGLDRATDVLSFSYDEPPPRGRARRVPRPPARGAAGRVHGDLVVSLDRVAEQARRFRVTWGEELARLVVHGALHLAGHDHQRPAERRRMRAREDAALAAGRAAARALGRVAPDASAARGTAAGARRRRA